MKDEFIIQRQGKDFVLFAGLLDEAHSRGLVGIETEILQYPWDNAAERAVVHAVALMDQDGAICRYHGTGDACAKAKGAGPAEKDAPIRMAETRAKARALRDAINVGVTALEEMGGGESVHDGEKYAVTRKQAAPTPEESGAVQGAAKDLNAATKDPDAAKQIDKERYDELVNLLTQDAHIRGMTPAERMAQMEDHLGFELRELSRGEADDWIAKFHKALAKVEAEA